MRLREQIGWYIFAFLCGIILPVVLTASSPPAEITHLVIKNSKNSLLVDLKIDSEFTPEIRAAVLNNVPVRLTVSINLFEVNDYWFDKKVAGKTVIHELRYDAVKKAYKIKRSRGTLRSKYFESSDAARLSITEINDLVVIALRDLEKGVHYQLMVSTVVSLKKFPHFNLYRDFESDRYTVNFIY